MARHASENQGIGLSLNYEQMLERSPALRNTARRTIERAERAEAAAKERSERARVPNA
jgi:N-glycosylase/DNA lyase